MLSERIGQGSSAETEGEQRMTKSSAARKLRRGKGRPPGSHIPLAADPKRFAMATWFALNEMGIGRYSAAYLTAVRIDSTEPITIERVEDVLVRVSAGFGDKRSTILEHHSDRMVRNAAKIFPRSNEDDRDW